jgi:hypothetical protein
VAYHARYWAQCEVEGCSSVSPEAPSQDELDDLLEEIGWDYFWDNPDSARCDWGDQHDVCAACLQKRPDIKAKCSLGHYIVP